MKNLLFIILSITFSTMIYSQTEEPVASWEKTTHDFGTFNESDGVQTATFEFSNTGSTSLIITNVRASCGCTTPDWSKEPIKPGEKGHIKAAYNPTNRPGKFNKSITVSTNETQPVTVLRITGEVIRNSDNN